MILSVTVYEYVFLDSVCLGFLLRGLLALVFTPL